jgi:hypothetical protein
VELWLEHYALPDVCATIGNHALTEGLQLSAENYATLDGVQLWFENYALTDSCKTMA